MLPRPQPPQPADSTSAGVCCQCILQHPLKWHLILTLGQPGDSTNNSTSEWPAGREQVDAGTLTLNTVEAEVGPGEIPGTVVGGFVVFPTVRDPAGGLGDLVGGAVPHHDVRVGAFVSDTSAQRDAVCDFEEDTYVSGVPAVLLPSSRTLELFCFTR